MPDSVCAGRLRHHCAAQLDRVGAEAVVATWKLGAVPQPLSARLPDAEYGHLLDLRERALLVGRPDPRGTVPSVPGDWDPGDVSRCPLCRRRFRRR